MIFLVFVPFLPLIGFWAWMFRHMTKNLYLPKCPLTITGNMDPRYDWTITFVFLNIFAAAYYYFTEYR
ncbi:MAG: hypothetical protein ACXWLH_01195 [Candidatus Saccharimonadales bacterium]